jgi:aspartyl aminopeptidase
MQCDLEHSPKSCWELYDSPEDVKAMDGLAADYVDFLSSCKTERETVEWVLSRAAEHGFDDNPGQGRVVRPIRGKSVLLARRGRRPLTEGFRLIGAHGDTPRLDLKQHPLYEDCDLGLAKTHYYGGIRKHQWLARPLALHGVAVKASGKVVRVSLGEVPGEPVFAIADLLPHLAQKQNEQKLSEAFDAEKLNIILGHSPSKRAERAGRAEGEGPEGGRNKKIKRKILELLNAKYGLIEEDLYSAELQLVPSGPARFLGLDEALIGGYGQDDRVCVYLALQAFLAAEAQHCQIMIVWDKEEIGSEGSTSARSLFLEYAIEDLIREWEPGARLSEVFAATKAISADVHGALDPDWQELHEKLNASRLGFGPVFCKFTGHRGKIGANDAHAEYVAWLRRLLNEAGVPWQMAELGKVDLGGGGTVAKHLAVYGMDIIDFGPGLLGMHSPFEICSKADLYATRKAYEEFLKS